VGTRRDAFVVAVAVVRGRRQTDSVVFNINFCSKIGILVSTSTATAAAAEDDATCACVAFIEIIVKYTHTSVCAACA